MSAAPVLVLTPVKNAVRHLDGYFRGLERLTYPAESLSLALLESDSTDGTLQAVRRHLARLVPRLGAARVFNRDFGFTLPAGLSRHAHEVQVQRRGVLAKARNHLLFRALDDEAWVLWLDVDVVHYPPDVIQRLLATGKDIVTPNCVREYGGPSFDLNAWRDHGRRHLHDLRGEGPLVPLDSVGGTMLLVRADVHRDGVVFPPFPYGVANPRIRSDNHWLGEIETEGLAMMAADAGVQCWGMPRLEVLHAPD